MAGRHAVDEQFDGVHLLALRRHSETVKGKSKGQIKESTQLSIDGVWVDFFFC